MPPSSAVTLTITAANEAEAQCILAAVQRAREGHGGEEILVTAASAPLGHSYRELRRARCAGLLDAVQTSRGLLLTRAALEAYRAAKAKPVRAAAPVADITERRVRALESAGVNVRAKR